MSPAKISAWAASGANTTIGPGWRPRRSVDVRALYLGPRPRTLLQPDAPSLVAQA